MLIGIAAAVPSLAVASCGTAFCTVNSNWTTESASTESGSVFDLRYESINQNHLRSGNRKVAAVCGGVFAAMIGLAPETLRRRKYYSRYGGKKRTGRITFSEAARLAVAEGKK